MSEGDRIGRVGAAADAGAGADSGEGVETKGVRGTRLLGVERRTGVCAAQEEAAAATGVHPRCQC